MVQAMCMLNDGRAICVDGNQSWDIQDHPPTTASAEAAANQDGIVEDLNDLFDGLDHLLTRTDIQRKQEVANGRLNRYYHRYSGFGDGERFNAKRRRWNINRRAQTRTIARQRGF